MHWTTRLRRHWPEYAMEASGLGAFMIAAAGFATLLQHPHSPVRQAIDHMMARRALMGVAMGATAIALIYSPVGARSGAHINPATTLTFLRLGRIHAIDAAAYMAAQFGGALAGLVLAAALLAPWIAAPSVNYVATLPGPWGAGVAFAAEAAIACLLMSVVLWMSRSARARRYTGLAVGTLVAVYITVEDPLSGMSLNPARSLSPALFIGRLDTLWIYGIAPPLGMLLAAELFRLAGRHPPCAKLHHRHGARCIFHCHAGHGAADPPTRTRA
jgi:aquaporin Z